MTYEIVFDTHAAWAVFFCMAALGVLIVDWNIREFLKEMRKK